MLINKNVHLERFIRARSVSRHKGSDNCRNLQHFAPILYNNFHNYRNFHNFHNKEIENKKYKKNNSNINNKK